MLMLQDLVLHPEAIKSPSESVVFNVHIWEIWLFRCGMWHELKSLSIYHFVREDETVWECRPCLWCLQIGSHSVAFFALGLRW